MEKQKTTTLTHSEPSETKQRRLRLGDPAVFARRKSGKIGLELESQRIREDGHLSQTAHPFAEEPYIDRDFGEAQIEINTLPEDSVEEAVQFLHEQLQCVHKGLAARQEWLWPFSGPPAISSENEIRIAEYTGEQEKKTIYRRYLASKYGKQKMTFCGIHYNYSFDEALLKENFRQADAQEFAREKTLFYLQLAEKVLAYSWVPVALLSASPLADGSFYAAGREGETIVTDYASMRCSEEGYWNPFIPLLSYEDIDAYAASIRLYRDKGLLRHEGELYYPVRIKPPGKYSLKNLQEIGISHIELRMIDLNPLEEDGVSLQDLQFLQLFLIWLASLERDPLGEEGQKRAVENQKAAAHLHWETIGIRMKTGETVPMETALRQVLDSMRETFRNAEEADRAVLEAQYEKLAHPEKRYPRRVEEQYGKAYLHDGIERAKQIQEAFGV